jgi:hypothetical protein
MAEETGIITYQIRYYYLSDKVQHEARYNPSAKCLSDGIAGISLQRRLLRYG